MLKSFIQKFVLIAILASVFISPVFAGVDYQVENQQEFTFTVMELRTVKLNRDNKMKKLWLLTVAAPELEKLRESYGLSSKLKDHDFHITIGTQVPGKPQAKVEELIFEEAEQVEEAA